MRALKRHPQEARGRYCPGGATDRMIMATKLLNQRIKDVMCARKRAGKADITPTLVDLERTHILYVNAHFKPLTLGVVRAKTRASGI